MNRETKILKELSKNFKPGTNHILEHDSEDSFTMFVPCGCIANDDHVGCPNHGLFFDYDKEYAYLNIAMSGIINKSFWQRIKEAWKILTKGISFCDEWVIYSKSQNKKEVERIAQFFAYISENWPTIDKDKSKTKIY